MAINQNLIDDLMNIGSSLFNTALEARHDIKARAKRGLHTVAGQIDLVTREEFDTAFAMLQKSRLMQEELSARLARIEAHLNLPATKKPAANKKSRLPTVKKAKRTKRA